MYTGGGKYYPDLAKFWGDAEMKDMSKARFPGFDPDLALYLVDELEVKGINGIMHRVPY